MKRLRGKITMLHHINKSVRAVANIKHKSFVVSFFVNIGIIATSSEDKTPKVPFDKSSEQLCSTNNRIKIC